MKRISRQKAAAVVIFIAAVLFLLSIWPLRLWTRDHTIGMDVTEAAAADSQGAGSGVGEFFLAQGTHLQTLSFYVASVESGSDIDILLYEVGDNGAITLLAGERADLPEKSGWVTVSMDVDTEPGRQYIAAATSGITSPLTWDNIQTEGDSGSSVFSIGLAVPDSGTLEWLQHAFVHGIADPGNASEYDASEENNPGIDGYFAMMAVTYREPLGVRASILAAIGIILAALVLYLILAKLVFRPHSGKRQIVPGRSESDGSGSTTIRRVCQVVLTPIVLLCGALGLIAAARGTFSRYTADNVLYFIGIVILACTALFALFGAVKGNSSSPSECAGLSGKEGAAVRRVLQTVFLALAIAFCCDYMNGLVDISHTVAEREMAFFFLLFLIATFPFRELKNPGTLTGLLISVPAGVIWVIRNYSPAGTAALSASDAALRNAALIWGALAATAFTVALINILRHLLMKRRNKAETAGSAASLRRRSSAEEAPEFRAGGVSAGYGPEDYPAPCQVACRAECRVNRPYVGVLSAFALWLIIFRNTRWWPVALVVLTGLLILRYVGWEERAGFLHTVTNAILLEFTATVIWCLLRRYFLNFIYIRFAMQFHTVTVTAEYLTMVFAVTLSRFLAKWKSQRSQCLSVAEAAHCLLPEAVMVSISAVYLLFTMSRTGLLGAAVTALVLLIAYAMTERPAGRRDGHMGKKAGIRPAGQRSRRSFSIARFLQTAVMLSVLTLVGFPAVFTAQRMIPAIVGRPYIFDGVEDYYWDDIVRNEKEHLDSYNWVTIERFRSEFGYKIFGIDEGEFDPEAGSASAEAEGGTVSSRVTGAPLMTAQNGTETVSAILSAPISLEISAAAQDTPDEGSSDGYAASAAEAVTVNPEEASTEDTLSGTADSAGAVTATNGRDPYEKDYTNGRTTIWRAYLKELNLTGHDTMGVPVDGKIMVHAHNTLLQTAYDFGIPGGILFLAFLILTFMRGVTYDRKSEKIMNPDRFVPMAMTVGYTMAGMVEWLFEVSNPCTFMLFLLTAPMLEEMDF